MLFIKEKSHTLTVGHIYYSSYKDIISNSSLTRAANGAELNRADYPELFAKIGTTFGEGNGSTTFNLPNLIHKFPEGDYHSFIGNYHNAGLPNIGGFITLRPHDLANSNGIISGSNAADGGVFKYTKQTRASTGAFTHSSTSQKGDILEFNASWSNTIYGNSSTVQPNSLSLNPVIVVRSNVYVAYCFRRTA